VAIAALDYFEDDMIWLVWLVPHGNRLVSVGIEGKADGLDFINPVALEQPVQLFQCHFDALAQRLRGW
jgi:flavin-dependent dehydrogenase